MQPSRNRHRILTCGASLSFLGILMALPAAGQLPFGPPQNLPPLTERRAAVLKEFDQDGDGMLSASEREKARLAWARQSLGKRDPGFFRPPPELMEEFDINKDGELDEEEGRNLRETMGRRFAKLTSDYDANGNGRLDEEEIDAASKDIESGKLKGIPRMFLQFARGGPRGGRRGPGGGPPGQEEPGEMDPSSMVRAADKDGDGRLSAEELAVAREAFARRRAAKLKPSPTAP